MKKMKKIIICLVIIGSVMTSLAFIPKMNSAKIKKSTKSTIIAVNRSLSLKPKSQTNVEILGTWINEQDTSYKLVFLDAGILKEYVNDELTVTLNYTISHRCGSENDLSTEFLKKIESDGSTYCFEINGVNENNSGILSIRSMENGKLYTFNKVN